MYLHRTNTIRNFGYDDSTNIDYQFNTMGYRSNREFDIENSPIILLGNTITFGLGVPREKTFAGIIEKKLAHPVYNFAWGCYAHTNLEQLALLKSILNVTNPRYVLFQINNLNRYRVNGEINFHNPLHLVIDEYTKFIAEIKIILNTVPHGYLHWDEHIYDVELPKCLVYNKYHVDVSVATNKTTFGIKTHKLIAEKILQENI
jgi:hypothetical protein